MCCHDTAPIIIVQVGPVLPSAPPAAMSVRLVNPTSMPIEVFSRDFDGNNGGLTLKSLVLLLFVFICVVDVVAVAYVCDRTVALLAMSHYFELCTCSRFR